MYDNLHLTFHLPEPADEFVAALAQSPAFAGFDGQTDSRGRVRVQYRGMRIEYVPGECKGRVRGSLHTFTQGSNVGMFSAAEAAQAAKGLAASLGLPPEMFIVRKLEAGVNLVVPSSPRSFLETLSHHKKSPILPISPPAGRLRPLEYQAVHLNYRLKYYDKGEYARRQGVPLPMDCSHLLRFEVVFTRARNLNKLTGRTNVTLQDLSAPDVLRMVATHVLEQWKQTVRRTPPDYSGLPIAHAALLYAGADLSWWESVRPHTPKSTFKRYQAQYRQLQERTKQVEGPHPYDILLAEHMRELCPDEVPLMKVSPKIGTILHTCNQLEIGVSGSRENREVEQVVDDIERVLAAA
ncbi:hypothetical protein K3G63_11220 [Hymenobacter sp. HSC-4F20]|uniref:hypothetical protein n=1 Tax=Hymenobacter sp. HSC-4F20 TaxID=2864135 RepID=UPI001C730D90|nr:hypothetical protein [Hymenobacter sp. HSC-4F20]MBX0291014.1 hypothetical protein [Hymenobacter sp. HSC-4F20]